MLKLLGVRDFVPNNWVMKLLADVLCAAHITENVCADVIFLLAGFDTSNLNKTRLPVYVSHTPAGTSVKDMIHFGQVTCVPFIYSSKLFSLFKNLKWI